MNQHNLEQYDIEIVESPAVIEDSIEIIESTEVVEEPSFNQIEVSEDNLSTVEYGEWNSPSDFEQYVIRSARAIPATFEGSKNSLKRAFAYLENLSNEISQGVEQDAPYADLSESQLRTLDVVEEGIDQALADISAAIHGKQRIKKIASKSSSFHTYINPFIFGLARVLINGKVSQGKNIESLFESLNKKYGLNDREHLELLFALNDMGHPIRSSFVDGLDRMEQYQA